MTGRQRKRRIRLLRCVAITAGILCLLVALLWCAIQEGRGIGMRLPTTGGKFQLWIPKSNYCSLIFLVSIGEKKARSLARSALDFMIVSATPRYPAEMILLIPYWLLAGLLLFIAVAAWHQSRKLGRVLAGVCPECGYDLSAHYVGDKCPECGTLIPPPPEPPAKQ